MEQKKNYTLPIVMMFLLFAMISFVTGLSNPLGVIVKNQFAVANWMSQLGNFANFIAYAVMGIPAGMMLKRIGYKKTALAAVVVGFVGVGIQYLSGVAGSFSVYLIGAFVSGFSMCMLNTVVNPMLNTLGGGGKKGNQLIQFGGSLNSISATIVPILVGYLMGNAANATISDAAPALFIAMGIFAVVFFVLAAVRIPEPFAIQSAKTEKKDKHSAMSFRHFVLGTVAIFIYVGVEVGIPNFMNLFLTSTPDAATPGVGMAAAAAGSLVGTYWFLMMCGRLIGGVIGGKASSCVDRGFKRKYIGGKVSSKVQLTVVSVVALAFVLLGIFAPIDTMGRMPVFTGTGFAMIEVPIGVMFLTLCGLCTSVMWGGIFNLAVEGLGKYTSMGSGIFMVMVCGGGILPLIQGYVADISNYLSSYWVIIAGLAYMLFYALVGSKNVNKDIPVEE
ncbi:MFS transporter [uncultured Alistipes sp.]|uniref:MFS transporter n=1 Tax=uncultured Alistipes sp. TaxID=538949 RepID=UPI00258275C6|nr:MFS transporter [uncultured Alistipes sp.]